MNENEPLTEEEARHLRGLKLYWEAQGRDDLVKQVDEMPPEVQRLSITMYHMWLDDRESFGKAWKSARRLLPLIRVYGWLKEKVRKVFTRSK